MTTKKHIHGKKNIILVTYVFVYMLLTCQLLVYARMSHHSLCNWSSQQCTDTIKSSLTREVFCGGPSPEACLPPHREYRDESTTRNNLVHFLPSEREKERERRRGGGEGKIEREREREWRGEGGAAATTLSKNAIKGSFRRNSGAKGRRGRRGNTKWSCMRLWTRSWNSSVIIDHDHHRDPVQI